ncbi:hypothetical protein ABFS83_12G057900 [Erythranthe nasuta]
MGEINKYGYVRFGSGLMAVQKKKSGPSLNDLQNNEYREESPNVSTPTIKLIERSRTRKIDLMASFLGHSLGGDFERALPSSGDTSSRSDPYSSLSSPFSLSLQS